MPRRFPPPSQFYLGLDLGQMQDYTALTALELASEADDGRRYHLRHAERLPLGTPYTAIAERIHAVQRTAPLSPASTRVVVDTTGVGLPVFEMLRKAGVEGLVGVTLHAGDAVSYDAGIYRVPKRDLVSNLQVLFQSERLKIAEGLPYGPVLRGELQAFKAKINLATGHDSYEAWREGDHDDLVLSLAMAGWFAERDRRRPFIQRPPSVVTSYAGYSRCRG